MDKKHFMQKAQEGSHWKAIGENIRDDCKRVGDEIILDTCPFCGKKDHCYVNLHKEVFFCHHCGEKGKTSRLKINELHLRANTLTPNRKPLSPNKYFKHTAFIYSYDNDGKLKEEILESPQTGNKRLLANKVAFHYLSKIRGISEESINFFELGLNANDNLQIPFRNKEGLLTGYKYRTIGASKKRYWRTRGSNLSLYNEQVLAPKYKWEELYITEGEFDCIVLCQEGKPSISSPLGAQGWNTDWNILIKNCEVKNVFLVYDNDSAGEFGAKKLLRTLKEEGIICQILNPFQN